MVQQLIGDWPVGKMRNDGDLRGSHSLGRESQGEVVSLTVSENSSGEISTKPKRHSPVFLAVFAVFVVATGIYLAGTVIGVVSAHPSHHDTQWFWASGHLLVHGKNPYDRQAMGHMETELGLTQHRAVPMTLNPPYALFLLMPIGLLGPRTGVVVWALLLTAFLAISVRSLTAISQQHERSVRWLAWLFVPALSCVEIGQTGLIVLLGLALFLRFHRSRPFCAAMALSLCAIKPHLLLPFGLVMLVWILARKKWLILAGAALAMVIESLIAVLFNHAIWANYRTMMHTDRFVNYFVPTLGSELRFAVRPAAIWIEFIPASLGCIWGLWYFWRNRGRWDWRTHGSLLILVSLVVAPYSWFTDQVLALPAILFVLLGKRELRRGSLTLLLAIMSAAELEMMKLDIYSEIYIAQCLAWLAWYLYATSGRPPAPAALPADVRNGNAVSA
ncbi:MAG: glycosyltransferase family 87 protein [Acidobacteriaceae bacterium]